MGFESLPQTVLQTYAFLIESQDGERDTATLVRVSAARRARAAAVLRRYLEVARAGFTHMVHIMVVDRRLQRVRLLRYDEIGHRQQRVCMSREVYQMLLDGIPAEWHQVLATASEMLRDRMQGGEACTLEDLMSAFPLPPRTWVQMPTGEVMQASTASAAAMRASGDAGAGDGCWTVSPTSRLAPVGCGVVHFPYPMVRPSEST